MPNGVPNCRPTLLSPEAMLARPRLTVLTVSVEKGGACHPCLSRYVCSTAYGQVRSRDEAGMPAGEQQDGPRHILRGGVPA